MTAVPYAVQVELDHRGVSNDDVDRIHERLDDWNVSITENLAGYLELTLTVPANSLRQATSTALALAAEIGTPTMIHAASEAIRDQRGTLDELPELVSVPEAGEILGYTRQNVLHLIDIGKLPAKKVARDYIIIKAALGPLMQAGPENHVAP